MIATNGRFKGFRDLIKLLNIDANWLIDIKYINHMIIIN